MGINRSAIAIYPAASGCRPSWSNALSPCPSPPSSRHSTHPVPSAPLWSLSPASKWPQGSTRHVSGRD